MTRTPISEKWKEFGADVPSLLPLQAPPQTQEQVIPYIQSLHNYMAGDRLSIVRSINVLSRHRLLQHADSIDEPRAAGTGTLRIQSDSQMAYFDAIEQDNVSSAVWKPLIPAYAADTKDPTGFVNTNTDSTIGISGGNFFIQPVSTSFSFYVNGRKFTKTAQETLSLAAATTEGNWYVYYNSSGTLVLDGSVTSEDIIRDNVFVAELYHDGTSITMLQDERHGLMPWQVHLLWHYDRGSTRRSGFGLTGMVVDQNGNDDEDAEFAAASGIFWDEDISHSIAAMTSNWDILYYQSNKWVFENTSATSPVKVAAGIPQYNIPTGGGSLAAVGFNRFFLMHIFATNIVTDGTGTAVNGHVAIVGQAEYLSQLAARTGANSEINDLITTGLPMPEFLPIATVIFQRKGSNSYNAAVVSTDTGDDYVSWLNSDLAPGSPPSSHANLTDRDIAGQHPTSAISMDDPGGTALSSVLGWDDINSWWELGGSTPVYLADDLKVGGNIYEGSTRVSLVGHSHTESDISDLDHTDTDAIHDNVAAEISGVAAVTELDELDVFLIEQEGSSPTAYTKKRIKKESFLGVFQCLKNGTQLATASYADIAGWATPSPNINPVSINTGTGVVTFNSDGQYLISLWVRGTTTGTARSTIEIQMLADTGSGFAAVSGAADSQYAFRDATNLIGSAQFNNFALAVTTSAATAQIKFQVRYVTQAFNIVGGDARMTIVKVA